MAKKKVSGIGAIDRKIAAKRKALSVINKKKSDAKRVAKKLTTLKRLESKLKTAKKRTK